MRYVVFDLEATCWKEKVSSAEMEIIEIGAVMLDSNSFESVDEFSKFVRPQKHPLLSEFCKELTTIQQKDVDEASEFVEVYHEFLKWLGPSSLRLISWGAYDIKQLLGACPSNEL